MTGRRRKTVAFLPAHPAQLRMLHPIAQEVSEFANVVWIVREKDCSLPLADAFGIPYTRISKAASGMLGNAIELTANTLRCWRIGRNRKIDLWVTKYGCGNLAARLTGASSISFNDDDSDIVPLVAWTSYPFADMTLVTQFTRMGRFDKRAVRYAGNAELFFLHPNRFTPDISVLSELRLPNHLPFAIVRLSSLQAHHDKGIRGLSASLLRQVIERTQGRVQIFIASEKPLAKEFEPLRFPLSPDRMPHALAFADFFLGDSQTMTSEAAVLGTPAFRINDFVGRISYLEELQEYGLAFGFKPGQENELLAELQDLLRMKDRKTLFASRRRKFLDDKIDPVPWHTEIIRMVLGGATIREVKEWATTEYGCC